MSAIAEDVYRTGTLAAADDVVELASPGIATVMVQLIVTNTNTTVFEVNVNQGSSPTWVAINVTNVNTGAVTSSATASGIYRADIAGAREFRVRCSSYTSGSAVVSMNGSVATARAPLGTAGVVTDTELPAAVALVTGTAAQTAPFVGAAMFGISAANTWNAILTASNLADGATGGQSLPAFGWIWNGTTWDRVRGATSNGASIASATGVIAVEAHLFNGGTTHNPMRAAEQVTDANAGGAAVAASNLQFNGTNYDRARNNAEATLLTSAARTATPTTNTITTYNARGITVVLDATAASATPSIVVTIDGVDAASGKSYNILTGAAITGISTNVYKVYPGIAVAANLTASQPLPRTVDINITHGDADSITYTVGYVLHY